MKINVYAANRPNDAPLRRNKWVRNFLDAQSFCAWYERTFGVRVTFIIC